jgi:hypothetical protein
MPIEIGSKAQQYLVQNDKRAKAPAIDKYRRRFGTHDTAFSVAL